MKFSKKVNAKMSRKKKPFSHVHAVYNAILPNVFDKYPAADRNYSKFNSTEKERVVRDQGNSTRISIANFVKSCT